MQGRSHHRDPFGWLFVVAWLAVGAVAVSALAAPIPAGPEAMTHAKLDALVLPYNERTLVGAYEKVGSHNPKWDARAKVFLEQMAKYFSGTFSHLKSGDLEAVGKKLLDGGCDDPLVAYCYAATYEEAWHEHTDDKLILKTLERAMDGLIARHYPPLRCFAAAQRLHGFIYDRGSQKYEKAYDHAFNMMIKYFKKTLETPVHNTLDRRFIWINVKGRLDDWKAENLGFAYRWAKRAHKVSPWFTAMIGGMYHANLAYENPYPGGKWKKEDKARYEKDLAAAKACFSEAWKLDPGIPDAAGRMIWVARWSGKGKTRARVWFDRAVKAQMDFMPAYRKYEDIIEDDSDEYYKFGLDCYETGRFDTEVPMVFTKVLRAKRDGWNPDGPGSVASWKVPGVYEKVARICGGFMDGPNGGWMIDRTRYVRTRWLAFAYLTEHWADARKQVDKLGTLPDWSMMKHGWRGGRYNLDYNRVRGVVYANTGPMGKDVQKATALARRGKMRQSLAIFKKLLAKPIKKPYVKRVLEGRAQSLQWRIPFDMNIPIGLRCKPDLAGWQEIWFPQHWKAQPDGSVVLTAPGDDGAINLYCRTNFGRYWELSGEITRMNAAAMGQGRVGIFLGNDYKSHLIALVVDPKKKELAIGKYGCDCVKHTASDANAKHIRLRVRMENDIATVWVNGKKLFDHQEIDNWPYNLDPHISLGGDQLPKGAKLRFSHFVIRHYDPNQKRSPVLLN